MSTTSATQPSTAGMTLQGVANSIQSSREAIQSISGRLHYQLIAMGLKGHPQPSVPSNPEPEREETLLSQLQREGQKLINTIEDLSSDVGVLEAHYSNSTIK